MRLSILAQFFVGASIFDHVVAWEGINCKGSSICGRHAFGHMGDEGKEGHHSILESLHTMIDEDFKDKSCRVPNGEVIACRHELAGSFCAFTQHTPGGKWHNWHINSGHYLSPGLNGTQFMSLLDSLMDHGCKVCGSVPIGYPENKDPDKYGVMTVNYVHYPTAVWNGVLYACEITQL
ncbi:hypothetical protein MMC08_001028 [Hypocenomyce scalaris]|nr:hypothetical protein [Hypocenomyce scalaris]